MSEETKRGVVIGLTGGIGSGKTTVGKMLAERLGYAIIDADKVGHSVYAPGTEGFTKVVEAFGSGIVAADGTIDRKALGRIVFSDRAALQRLNSIVWPLIARRLRELVQEMLAEGRRIVVIEAAVLIEAEWQGQVDEVWVVTASPETAIQRLMARNGLSEEDARKRLSSQLSNEERCKHATVVLENTGSLEELAKRIDAELAALRKRWPCLETDRTDG